MDGLKGANVESGDQSFPIKMVLPVPASSANVDLGDAGVQHSRLTLLAAAVVVSSLRPPPGFVIVSFPIKVG